MSTISSIINKTEFIKTCGIGSLIFTGSTAIIACISCYITFENYKLTNENRTLIQQLLHDNNKIHKLLFFERTKNVEVAIEAPKSPEFIVVPDNNYLNPCLRENEEIKKSEENVKNCKHEKDYLDMFEDYYDIVLPDNNENKGFSLYKLFRLM
jgi:hypothetical protein